MKLVSLAILCGGAALVAMALPRVGVGVLAIPGDDVIDLIEQGRPIDMHSLNVLIASRQGMLSFVENSRARAELGYALFLRGSARDPLAQQDIREAVEELCRSLMAAPAQPYAWTRLAYALLARGAPRANIAAAMHMAITTAPHDGPPFDSLLIARLGIGLALFDYLSEEDRALVQAQLRVAWQQKRDDLVALAYKLRVQKTLREMLPEASAELDSLRF